MKMAASMRATSAATQNVSSVAALFPSLHATCSFDTIHPRESCGVAVIVASNLDEPSNNYVPSLSNEHGVLDLDTFLTVIPRT